MKSVSFEEFSSRSEDKVSIELFRKLEEEIIKNSITVIKVSSPYCCRSSHSFGGGSTGYQDSREIYYLSERFFLDYEQVSSSNTPNILEDKENQTLYVPKLKSDLALKYESSYDSGFGRYVSPKIQLGELDEEIYKKNAVGIITDLQKVNEFLDEKFSIFNYEGETTLATICYCVLSKNSNKKILN